MIIATFDLTGGWTFNLNSEGNLGICFADGGADRIYPDALTFGYTVTVNGDETDSLTWPPSNIVIRELSPSRVFPYRLDAAPDDEVTLLVWATNAGVTFEGETTFTAPGPEQPYPSWTWSDGEWTAPVPYPDGDGWYEWDEEALDWVVIPESDYEVE